MLSNAPSFDKYVCCSGEPSQMTRFLITIRWGRLLSVTGESCLRTWKLTFLWVESLSSHFINWLRSIAIPQPNQSYCRCLVKLEDLVLPSVNCTLDLPQQCKWTPCTSSCADRFPSPQEETHRHQYGEGYSPLNWSGGHYLQGMCSLCPLFASTPNSSLDRPLYTQ